jgi:ubiquinone/menaquinone biosynthesis C-methylase UbiE
MTHSIVSERARMAFAAALLFCAAMTSALAEEVTVEPDHFIRVTSKASLVHLGSLDSFDITTGGVEAARLMFEHLGKKNPDGLRKAFGIYEKLIPSENFGGEYTALQWLCELFLAPKKTRAEMLSDPLVLEWYDYLAKNNFAPLKTYLKQKYHLAEWKDKKTPKTAPEYRFLEDFILFNNPERERWEQTSKMMQVLNLKKGEVVADVGSGPGYFSFKFAKIVGDTGYVYAIDTNKQHMDFVSNFVKKYKVKNVEAVEVKPEGTKLAKKADVAYLCSLYHNIYASSTFQERDGFIQSIKDYLKPDGRLVIVDNALVVDKTLPYHGPYISKDLIINQLWYYGFTLVEKYQFIPQRYILVFKLGAERPATVFDKPLDNDCVPTASKASVIHFSKGSSSPGFTLGGRKAAGLFYRALETKAPEDVHAALAAYEELIPKERFGDEYTAFQWFCNYLLASADDKEKLLADGYVRDYFERLSADDYKLLKKYLKLKYYLDTKIDDAGVVTEADGKIKRTDELELAPDAGATQDEVNAWGEFISFENPNRGKWEQTDKMLDFLKIKPGEKIADLGCGAGYYTFKLSKLTGPDGIVYAIDTEKEWLAYVDQESKKHGVTNVQTVIAKDNNSHMQENSADLIYICSMYHYMYVISMEYVRDGFIEGIKKALRKDGRLVIADNAILPDDQNPYFGPAIEPEMIISQLKFWGFHLVDRAQFIPQRYVLVFQKD